ncbi:MAG: amidohydrolase [Clostridia bacterium]|nr:amidohydrolase [Clostridia bacterium]MBQ8333383.1 amidohydrolase [Clostridia bacterium]
MNKVFDIHTHTYPEAIAEKACVNLGKFYDFIVEGEGTYAHLESQAKENNVCGYLLFSVCTNAQQVQKVNSSIAALAELSRSHGFKTVGYAGMHQDYPDFRGELERCAELGLRGVKIHPDIQGVDINDARLLPLYEIMQETDMPLYLHMGDNRPQYRFSEAKKLAEVLDRFPRLRVVAAHLGGHKAWDEALEYLAGRPNVMYDTSSALWAMTPETAFDIIHKLGVKNVMFGTDYPVKNTAGELERFHAVGLSAEEEADILWNNAIRFLGLED